MKLQPKTLVALKFSRCFILQIKAHLFVCLFVCVGPGNSSDGSPIIFRELAQAQEVALVPLYQVLPVEFRHEPGIGEGNKHS